MLVEVFKNRELEMYHERFRAVLPEYMRDPVDYYMQHGIEPSVVKYNVSIFPIHNGMPIDFAPILFEEGDDLDVKYSIQRQGAVDFNEYMQFLHEAYKVQNINIDNDYHGIWSLRI